MIKINLNPDKERRIKKSVKLPSISVPISNYAYIGLVVVPPVLAVGFSFWLGNKIEKLKEEEQNLIAEKNKYKEVERKINMLQQQYSSLVDIKEKIYIKTKTLEKLKEQKTDFVLMIKALGKNLPDGVWLNKVYLSRGNSQFDGFSFKPEYLSYFAQNLKKNYKSVSFNFLEKKENKVNEYYVFSIKVSSFSKE